MIYKFYTSTNVTLAVGQEGASTLPNTFAFSEPFKGGCVGGWLTCRQQQPSYKAVNTCLLQYAARTCWPGALGAHEPFADPGARVRHVLCCPLAALRAGKEVTAPVHVCLERTHL